MALDPNRPMPVSDGLRDYLSTLPPEELLRIRMMIKLGLWPPCKRRRPLWPDYWKKDNRPC